MGLGLVSSVLGPVSIIRRCANIMTSLDDDSPFSKTYTPRENPTLAPSIVQRGKTLSCGLGNGPKSSSDLLDEYTRRDDVKR